MLLIILIVREGSILVVFGLSEDTGGDMGWWNLLHKWLIRRITQVLQNDLLGTSVIWSWVIVDVTAWILIEDHEALRLSWSNVLEVSIDVSLVFLLTVWNWEMSVHLLAGIAMGTVSLTDVDPSNIMVESRTFLSSGASNLSVVVE